MIYSKIYIYFKNNINNNKYYKQIQKVKKILTIKLYKQNLIKPHYKLIFQIKKLKKILDGIYLEGKKKISYNLNNKVI